VAVAVPNRSKLEGWATGAGVPTDDFAALHTEEFGIENDLITPTFKLKRPQLLEYFKEQVDGMYTSLKRA